jgi:ribonuclease R
MGKQVEVTRQTILDYMQTPNFRPGKMKELARKIEVPQATYRDFRRLVKELEGEGLVVRLRHNRYSPVNSATAGVVGMLRVHPRGFGFVITEGNKEDIFIPPDGMREGVDGDQVRAEVTAEREGEKGPEGRIVEVVKRTERKFVGIFLRRGRRMVVEVDDPALGRDIFLNASPVDGVQEGEKVLVRITERGWGYDGLQGEIAEVLGDPEDPALDFLSTVRRFDLPVDFPTKVMEEMAGVGLDMDREKEQRADLRSVCCFTIDPKEARDFDDAVSVETLGGGGYRLGVHIADVSHFVQSGTALDREAFTRGTSVYLVDRVIHMLPERLAAELCTLKAGEDRLAISVFIKMDGAAEVMGFELQESVIRSAGRLTYREVQAVFDGDEEGIGEAADFSEPLQLLRQVSQKRGKIRRRRGSLDFDLPEPWVEVDAEGRPTALGRYPRLESHRLIEECMLLANECVGKYLGERGLPVLYRIHRAPDWDKLQRVIDLLPHFQLEKEAVMQPRDLQLVLRQIEGRKDGPLLNKLLLQALRRAEYAPEDVGHFGLACRGYLHFTSPIRRYPDLLVHRVLKAHLSGDQDQGYSAGMRDQMGWMGKWTSECERKAEEAERFYVKVKQLRYMDNLVGEVFPGVVSGVLRGGFFVSVGDFMVEGFCFLRDMEDYFEFDAQRHRLRGCRTGNVIQLGLQVDVQIVGVDWKAQEMDLLLVEGKFPSSIAQKRKKKKKRSTGKGQKKKRRRR